VSTELGLHPNHRKRFTLKVAEIRGIGGEERVYVLESEFQRLGPRDQAMFAEAVAQRCEVFDLDTPAQ
jgi:hypothetical protein